MAAQQTSGNAAQPPPASAGTDTPSSAWTDVWQRAEAAANAAPVDPGAAVEAAIEGASDEAEATEPEAAPAKAAPKKTDEGETEETEADEKNAGAVSIHERRKWREQKRAERQKLEQFKAQRVQELQQIEQQLAQKYGKYAQAEAALEAGDVDGYCKAIHGKPWDEFSKEQLRRKVTPEYQRLAKLEQELQERKAQEAKAQAEAQERAAQAEQARERQEFLQLQAEELKAAVEAGETVAALDDPEFHQAVFMVREQYWDGQGTISAAEAASIVVENCRKSAQMRARYEFLHNVFGDQAASQPETAQAVAPRVGSAPVKRGAAKAPPKAVSQRNAVEASPPGGAFDQQSWFRKYSAALRSSTLE